MTIMIPYLIWVPIYTALIRKFSPVSYPEDFASWLFHFLLAAVIMGAILALTLLVAIIVHELALNIFIFPVIALSALITYFVHRGMGD